MRQRIAGRFLSAEQAGHFAFLEGSMIASSRPTTGEGLHAQRLQRCQFLLKDRVKRRPSARRQSGHLAGAGVVNDGGGDFRQFVFVLLHVGRRAMQPLFLAGEEDKAKGALRLYTALRQDAGCFQNNRCARPVVGRSLPQVLVNRGGSAEHDHLIGFFAPADLAYGVVDDDRAGNELVAGFQPRRALPLLRSGREASR